MEKRLTLYISIWGNLIIGIIMTNKILVLIHIITSVILLVIYIQKTKNKW
jgi:hypothetical protein